MSENKRGRPPLPANVRASETIPGFRATKAQKKQYKAAAKKLGLSLSAWFKALADQNS